MKKVTAIAIVVACAVGGKTAQAQGGSSVTQSVTIEVKPITQINVTGNPGPLVIRDAVPGGDLTPVVDNNTKYSVTTNLENMKIVASLDNQMPAGTHLMINLASSKASSAGAVDLTTATSPVTVVTGLSRASDRDQQISYVFSANAGTPEIQAEARTVTLTVSE